MEEHSYTLDATVSSRLRSLSFIPPTACPISHPAVGGKNNSVDRTKIGFMMWKVCSLVKMFVPNLGELQKL